MQMIFRTAGKEIKILLKQFPVIVLLGPRQVGKTTLVSELVPEIEKDAVWFDLEKPSDYDKMNNAELVLGNLRDKCVIIDEIQLRPELFSLLRPLVDAKREPCRFIILGSASPSIVKGVSESLAGRAAYHQLMPFSLPEVQKKISMEKHHFVGGFPDSALAGSDNASKKWLDNFIRSYTEIDLQKLGIGASPVMSRRLWEMLAWQNGNLVNYSALGNSLGISYNTVKGYVDYFEGAFLISRLLPFHNNIKKRLVKSPKIYINDTGILHRLLRIQDFYQLQGSPMMGASWEAYVLAQVRASLPSDIDLYFYRTHAGAEVDLVFTKGLKPIATAEIKYSLSPEITKGMLSVIDDLKTSDNFVIIPSQDDDYPIKKNIVGCGLNIFLEKYLPEL